MSPLALDLRSSAEILGVDPETLQKGLQKKEIQGMASSKEP